MNRIIAVGILIMATTLTGAGPNAGEARFLISNGVKEAVHELLPSFERSTGHRLSIRYGTAAFLQRDIENGEVFDGTIIPAANLDAVVKSGKVNAATLTGIARSRIGIAVRKGAPKPDISTVEAFKHAILNAKAVAYATAGTSGVHFIALSERLGIANEVKAKGKTMPGGFLAEFVVKGEAELVIQQISELLPVEGVEVVGPIPAELQLISHYTAA